MSRHLATVPADHEAEAIARTIASIRVFPPHLTGPAIDAGAAAESREAPPAPEGKR